MMSLPVFLLARLDEDEAAAKAAIGGGESDDEGGWVIVSYPYEGSWPVPPDDDQAASVSDEAWAIHATRHSPARVLADVEAKRRIVDWAAPVVDWERVETERPGVYDKRPVRHVNEDGEDVLRLLALPYADHPDYREEWKP